MKYSNILRNLFIIVISVLLVAGFVKAGSLNPALAPAATFYTLDDIYTRLTNNAAGPVLEGSHNLGPAALPVGTMRTLKEIYEIIPPINAAKLLSDTTYLGVTGTIDTKTLSADSVTVNAGYYAATTLSAVDGDLAAGNILKDTAIFGITGTLAPAGTAAATDCLDTKTFYSANSWVQKTGSIINGSNVTVTSSTPTNMPAGYYSGKTCSAALTGGTGSVAAAGQILSTYHAWDSTGNVLQGSITTQTLNPANDIVSAGYYAATTLHAVDGDLATGNIRSTVNIFGVAGDPNVVDTSSGDAVLTDILSGKKAWVDGAEVTGNVTAGANVSGGEGLVTFNIPNGLYSGSKTCTAVDGDLSAVNIKSGITILGQLGTFKALLPTTFQVLCYDTDGGPAIACNDAGWPDQDADASGDSGACTPTYTQGTYTVTDSCTNLEWQRYGHGSDDGSTVPAAAGDCDLYSGTYSASYCTYSWQNALKYCSGLTLNGSSDWRLPNVKELQSIVEYSINSPAIDTTKFSTTQSDYYWSSTTYALGTSYAWIVYFGDGAVRYNDKTSSYRVRCVRQY